MIDKFLYIVARGLHQDLAVAQVAAQREELPGGAEAAAQQADRVEFAQPLTVGDVTLAAGDVFDVVRVDLSLPKTLSPLCTLGFIEDLASGC